MRDRLALVEVGRLGAAALLEHVGELRVETEGVPSLAGLEGAVRLEEGLLGEEAGGVELALQGFAQLGIACPELRAQVALVLVDDLVDDGDRV